MEIASLGISVKSDGTLTASERLDRLTTSAAKAESVTGSLARSASATSSVTGSLARVVNDEATAMDRAARSTAAHTAAMNANAAATARNSMMQRQLMFQMVDMGQALPLLLSGNIYGLQNMGFQIAQIGQMYYGQGGMGAALKDMGGMLGGALSRIWPVAAAVGVVASGIAGLTYEINQTSDAQVGFFDVVTAGWQLLAEQITSLVAPVFGAIADWLKAGWDAAVPVLKNAGNSIVGTFAFAIQAIGALWNGLPAAVGDAIIKTANVVISGLEWTINKAAEWIDGFIGKYNEGLAAMGQKTLPTFGNVQIPRAANPYEGALGALGTSIGDAGSAFETDYLGQVFGSLSARAQQIALARQELDGLGGSAKAANDNVKTLAEDGLAKVGQFGKQVLSTLSSGFADLFKGLITGTKTAGEAISDLLGKLGDLFINQAFNMLFGGIFGGGFGGGLGGGGLFGLPSFDGGGWTGDGARSGGIDGKGGYPAIIHPREYISDTTKPANQNNADGGRTVIEVRLSPELLAQVLQEAAGQSAKITRGMVEPVSRTVNQMAQQQRFG